MVQPLTVQDDAVQASVLAGAFHAAMFFVVAGAFLLFGLPRAAGGAALLGALMWATSLLYWAVQRATAWALARHARRRLARRAPPARGEVPVSR